MHIILMKCRGKRVRWAGPGAFAAENLAELGVKAGEVYFRNRLNKRKLKSALKEYIERQRKYNDLCGRAEEVDFRGLIVYITENLMEDAEQRFFAVREKERGKSQERIVAAAVAASAAETPQARQRVAGLISASLEMIRDFYKKRISPEYLFLAEEVTEAVSAEIGARIQEENEKNTETILKRVEEIKETVEGGLLFSLEAVGRLAEKREYAAIEKNLKMVCRRVALTHSLSPYYGTDFREGKLVSKALIPEAEKISSQVSDKRPGAERGYLCFGRSGGSAGLRVPSSAASDHRSGRGGEISGKYPGSFSG